MLIHPWDAATGAEWRAWIDAGHDFGQLIGHGDPWPLVVPTHFVHDDDVLLVHLARPNPLRRAIEHDPHVVLAVTDDYAYIPTTWRETADQVPGEGVPTSYYSSVHFHCEATIVDDPAEKALLITRQLAHFQPEGGHRAVSAEDGPYQRLLAGVFGIRLAVREVRAKFKYDDHKPAALREEISRRLTDRGSGRDLGARRQQEARAAREIAPPPRG